MGEFRGHSKVRNGRGWVGFCANIVTNCHEIYRGESINLILVRITRILVQCFYFPLFAECYSNKETV